jgi:glycosyltransferase involved in cell wall biosynthesis
MKITVVTGFFLPVPPVAGGSTEKIWYRLAKEFAAAGHEITFISRAWPGFADRETVDGVTHVRVQGADHTRSLALNLWRDFTWGRRVARALPEADIVICNTVTLPAWLRGLKPRAGRVVAVLARVPKGQGRFYGRVDRLFSLSPFVDGVLLRENPRLAARIVRFPYPIDWSLHASAATKSSPLTIGYVGRIHPEKGIRLLLAAAARLAVRNDLPPWRLELVGPWTVPQGGGGKPYYDELLGEFAGPLASRLMFAGPEFDVAKLAQRYGAMDIFCYPSVAEQGETFGVAIAEAMAAGAAPVVSSLACFSELVRDRDTGLVFDHRAGDADTQLADSLARLLTDAALRRAIATRAQAHARAYDFSASARTVLAELARVVSTPIASRHVIQ